MYLSAEGGSNWQYEFPHANLKNGDIIKLGNLKNRSNSHSRTTPIKHGFLLTDIPSNEEPLMLFTGDFIFVGDIGMIC